MEPILHDAIAVIGHPQHGKSTFGRMLADLSGEAHGATSAVILGFLSDVDGVEYGKDWHTTVPTAEQEAFRRRLVRTGDALCNIRQHLLSETLYTNGCRIIDGIRRKLEHLAMSAHMASMGRKLITVWVDRPDEPVIVDNTSVTKDDADWIVTNRTLMNLEEQARQLLIDINWPMIKNT